MISGLFYKESLLDCPLNLLSATVEAKAKKIWTKEVDARYFRSERKLTKRMCKVVCKNMLLSAGARHLF